MARRRQTRNQRAITQPATTSVAAGVTRSLYTHQAVDTLAQAFSMLSDPDELMAKAGISRTELEKLENDDEVGAALDTRCGAILTTAWRLEPGEKGGSVDSPEIRFVWNEIERVHEELVRASFNGTLYGYEVVEYVYQEVFDGDVLGGVQRTGFGAVMQKPRQWFHPMNDGTLLYQPNGFTLDRARAEVCDQQVKFLLCVHRPTYKKPRGFPLLSRVYWPWFFRSHGWQFWAKFLERNAAPLLVGHTPNNVNAMVEALERAVASGVAAVGGEDKVEAVAPGNIGAAFERFIDRSDKRMQKTILGQTLTTDVADSGSRALGDVHDQVRQDRKLLDNRAAKRALQHAVNALWIVNGFAGAPPTVVLEAGEGLGEKRAERDVKISSIGGIQFTRKYFERAYEFEPDDIVLRGEAGYVDAAPVATLPDATPPGRAGSAPLARGAMIGTAHTLAAGAASRFTPEQQAVEQLAATALERANWPIDYKRLRAIVEAAATPGELANALADELRGFNPAESMALLERCIFAAELLGWIHGEEEPPPPAE